MQTVPVHVDMAARLKDARKRAGLTQAELAGGAGLSVSYVQKVESGLMRNTTLASVEAVSSILGVQPAWLAFGVGRRT